MGAGWWQVGVAADPTGEYAKAEAGYHIAANISAFAQAKTNFQTWQAVAGIGGTF